MAGQTPKKNIYEKLNALRMEFMKANVQKTGVNEHSEYLYFELSDILPVAIPLLEKYNLCYIITFPGGCPQATLYNCDNPKETISFFSEQVDGPIITTKGSILMTDIQSEGAKQTYHRRYLWMQMLEVVELDEVDNRDTQAPPKSNTEKPKTSKPVTAEERQEIKEELTEPDGGATELQIEALKAVLKKMDDLDPNRKDFINQILVKTEGLTKLTKEQAENLITQVGAIVTELEGKTDEVAVN